MRSTTWLFLAVSCSLATGCLGDFFNLQPTSDAPDQMVEIPPSKFPQCGTGYLEEVDTKMLMDSKVTDPTPGMNLYEEVPISPNGCIRWFQQIVDGRITSRGMIAARGFYEVFTELDGGIGIKESQRYLTKEDITPDTNRLEIDRDGDGHPESVTLGRYDKDGLIDRVMTFFSASNGSIIERRTLRRVDAEKIRWTVEEQISGELKVTKDFIAPREMEATSVAKPTPCIQDSEIHEVTCTQQQAEAIDRNLRDMLPKAEECLKRGRGLSGNKDELDYIEHVIKSSADKLLRRCVEGKKYVAMISPEDDSYGYRRLSVNTAILRCQDANFIQSTLMHEVLHVTKGPHDPALGEVSDQMSDEAKAYTDPMRACEELCFGDIKTKCSCAACFGTQACAATCSGLASCTKTDFEGNYTMSQAVGALCKRPAGSPGGSTWNPTLLACETHCEGGTCKSYTLACNNANCN